VTSRLAALAHRLRRDAVGVAALEFALVLPVLLLLFLGTIETAVMIFIDMTIESAVFEAARFGITVTPGISREQRVRQIVADHTYGLVDMDRVTIDTLIYARFADIGKPEPFVDQNGNHVYDLGEPFTDVNGSGFWEADMGKVGMGGWDDVVVYRVHYSWGIMTPLIRDLMGDSVEHVAAIAVRNEPA